MKILFYSFENNLFLTLAVGSAVLIARKAENEVVPPPIRRYLIFLGMLFGSDGIFVGIVSVDIVDILDTCILLSSIK